MERIALSAVQPGHKLAKNIYSPDGKILYFAGEVISEAILKDLKKFGVKGIAIVAEQGALPILSDDIDRAVQQIIDARFGPHDKKDPFVNTIYTLAAERENRLLLSRHSKLPTANPMVIPAFQTQKPSPVQMEKLLKVGCNLGTLPAIFHRLIEIINNPYASASDAAKIIATDPALSIKLLRLVNSAFYALSTKIDTIDRAVAFIGTGQLVMLAMGATLVTAFKGLPVALVNMQSFWNHSLACGVAAKILAKRLQIKSADTFFIAGLLHDIGRLIFLHQIPTHSLYMITEAKRRQLSIRTLEQECLGFTHEQLSAALLEAWNCPKELSLPILTHHDVVTNDSPLENSILPLANFLSQALGYGSSGEPMLHYVTSLAWTKVHLKTKELPELSQLMEEQVRGLRALLVNSND